MDGSSVVGFRGSVQGFLDASTLGDLRRFVERLNNLGVDGGSEVRAHGERVCVDVLSSDRGDVLTVQEPQQVSGVTIQDLVVSLASPRREPNPFGGVRERWGRPR